MSAAFEPIVGRYLTLQLDGRANRIYFEEAGQGIPLLCVHTAGADARQWRHLLEDRTVTSRYRVIAYDLPYHGRSLPAQSFPQPTRSRQILPKPARVLHCRGTPRQSEARMPRSGLGRTE